MSSRWTRRVAAAFAVWVVAVSVSRVLGGTPDVGLVGLTVAALASVLWLGVDALDGGAVSVWDLDPDDPVLPPGEDFRLAALTRMLVGHLESRRPSDRLPRQLAGLADQRLMARYGVSWRVDPDRARPLLGPELAALAERVQQPGPAGDPLRLTRAQVDVLLSRIEAL